MKNRGAAGSAALESGPSPVRENECGRLSESGVRYGWSGWADEPGSDPGAPREADDFCEKALRHSQ